MCMSCGCMEPNNDHGDDRNITADELNRAAEAANTSTEQTAQNIMACCRMMSSSPDTQDQMGASPGSSA